MVHKPYPAKNAMPAATISAPRLAYLNPPIERGSSRTADAWAEYIWTMERAASSAIKAWKGDNHLPLKIGIQVPIPGV